MPISESDLRDLLTERTAGRPVVVDRVGQVRGRIARRRRHQRIGAGSGSATVGGGTSASAPEYYGGGKLIASVTLHVPDQTTASVEFTPTNWNLSISTVCVSTSSSADLYGAELAIAVNGHQLSAPSCGGGMTWYPQSAQHSWEAVGVHLGSPAELTAAVATVFAGASVAPPSPYDSAHPGTLIVGVYQAVPLAAYSFSPAPKKLLPLEAAGPTVLDSRKVGANGTWIVPVTTTKKAMITGSTLPACRGLVSR